MPTQVSVITSGRVAEPTTGMATRYWEVCGELARHFTVTLVAPVVERAADRGFELLPLHETRAVRELVDRSDVIIAALDVMPKVRWLLAHPGILCIDLIWPKILEDLERLEEEAGRPGTAGEIADHQAGLELTTQALQRGDLFLCGNERQRDFWLGWLGAAGRLNRAARAVDEDFSAMVRIVSTGIPSQPLPDRCTAARGEWPGLGDDDFLLVWGGGVWDWTDPFTPLRAMQRLADRDPRIKLLYVGLTPPTPGATPTPTGEQLIREAQRVGLAGRTVFIHRGWTPREQFDRLLRAADLGISFHKPTLESRFSIRTRLFDYVWAGLPIVTAAGDALADFVAMHGLGIVIAPDDDVRFADTVLSLRHAPERLLGFRDAMEQVASQWSWERVCQPLIEFCGDPKPRADSQWVRAMARPYSSTLGAGQRKWRLLRTHGLRAALADFAVLRRLKRRLFG